MKYRAVVWTGWLWLLGFTAFLAFSYYPFTPDSFAYVGAARSLAEAGRLLQPFAETTAAFVPVPYTAWPPGYPVAIALLSGLVGDSWLAARLLSVIGILAAAALFFRAVHGRVNGPVAWLLFATAALTAVAAATAWSEGPFAACVIATWVLLDRWHRSRRPRLRWLFLASCLVGAAVMFRNAGLFLLAPMLYLGWRRPLWVDRFTATSAALLAAIPAFLWFARNAAVSEHWRGWQALQPVWWRAPAELCAATGELIVLPWSTHAPLQAVFGAMILVLLAFTAFGRLRPRSVGRKTETVAAFALALLAGPAVARATGASWIVDARLIWPALPFIALILAQAGWRRSRRTVFAGTVLLAFFLSTQAAGILSLPYLHPRWEGKQEAVRLPVDLEPGEAILANRGWILWKSTGHPAYNMPLSYRSAATLAPDSLAEWARKRGVRYLVWQNEDRAEAEMEDLYGQIAGAARTADFRYFERAWSSERLTTLEIRCER